MNLKEFVVSYVHDYLNELAIIEIGNSVQYAKNRKIRFNGVDYVWNEQRRSFGRWARNKRGFSFFTPIDIQPNDDAPVIDETLSDPSIVDAPILDDEIKSQFGFYKRNGAYCIPYDGNDRIGAINELFPIDNPKSSNRTYLRGLTPERLTIVDEEQQREKEYLKEITNALDFCGRVLDNYGWNNIQIYDVDDKYRLRIAQYIVERGEYNEDTRLIKLSGDNPQKVGQTVAHEIGHVVESLLPGIRDAILKQFIEFTTDPIGKTRNKRFVVGKEYFYEPNIESPSFYAFKDLNDRKTEMISVFFHLLYANPVRATKTNYRQFFETVEGVLRK